MPEELINIKDFVKDVWEDCNSPTTSHFISRLGQCKSTVNHYENLMEKDKSNLGKLKKSLKALRSSGNMLVLNQQCVSENLGNLAHFSFNGFESRRSSADLESSTDNTKEFIKFSIITKELALLLKNLMQKLSHNLLFPVENLLKSDENFKGCLRKNFDKSWKDYEIKFNKIEKEKKQLAKDAGMVKNEITGPEVAEEMERERRMLQLHTCEYLIKMNEIKTKKNIVVLSHLVEFYHAQNNYFKEGLATLDHYKSYVEELTKEMVVIKKNQEAEKEQLFELKEVIKKSIDWSTTSTQQPLYRLHQLQGNKIYGCTKSGFLLKKSDGMVRKVWQKRKCYVDNGLLYISHSDASKAPVKLNLLTCQVKLLPDDFTKRCFDLVSGSENRTYHFQAEDHQDLEAWTSVLNNAKNAVLMMTFSNNDAGHKKHDSTGDTDANYNNQLMELSQTIITKVKKIEGNKFCCDCNAADPEWLSVNLGILICLECCGVHRLMGVHISRTQSTVIDQLNTSQLLIANSMKNKAFNEVMEANLTESKPHPKSSMEERKVFIRRKYEKKMFLIMTSFCMEDRVQDLKQAIISGEIHSLLQVYAEGVDFMQPLPDMPNHENALHLSIMHEDGYRLHIVDFIIQNSNSKELGKKTSEGNTALHVCCYYDKPECMKLLLRSQPELVDVCNNKGLLPLDVAMQTTSSDGILVQLLKHAMQNKTFMFDNVNIDWELDSEENFNEGSDFDVDWKQENGLRNKARRRSRPGSLVLSTDVLLSNTMKQRTATMENLPATLIRDKGMRQDGLNSHLTFSTTSNHYHKAPPPPPPSVERPPSHTRNPSDSTINYDSSQKVNKLKLSLLQEHPPALPPKPSVRIRSQLIDLMQEGNTTQDLCTSIIESHHPSKLNKGFNVFQKPPDIHTPYSGRVLSDERIAEVKQASLNEIHPTKNNKVKCVAVKDCDADHEDELSFKKGEIIIAYREDEDMWWEGQIADNENRKGLFPTTYVNLMP